MVSQILPMVHGLSCSLMLNGGRRLEESVKAGENTYLTALFQVAQGASALSMANGALKAAGHSPLGWIGRSVVLLSPLLAICTKTDRIPESVRPVVVFLHHHMGTFYQIASVVSAFALLYFGQTLLAVMALVVLGLGILDRNGWMPLRARQIFHQISPPLLTATGLIAGDVITRVFVVISLASWGARVYLDRQKTARQVNLTKGQLTFQKLQQILQEKQRLKINADHIHCNRFPRVPNIDIQTLIEQFGRINWENPLYWTKNKLMTRAR